MSLASLLSALKLGLATYPTSYIYNSVIVFYTPQFLKWLFYYFFKVTFKLFFSEIFSECTF